MVGVWIVLLFYAGGFALNGFGVWLLCLWFAFRYCYDLTIVLFVNGVRWASALVLAVADCLVSMWFID